MVILKPHLRSGTLRAYRKMGRIVRGGRAGTFLKPLGPVDTIDFINAGMGSEVPVIDSSTQYPSMSEATWDRLCKARVDRLRHEILQHPERLKRMDEEATATYERGLRATAILTHDPKEHDEALEKIEHSQSTKGL